MYVRSPPGRKCLKAGAQRTLEGVGSSAWFGWVGGWTPNPARQLRKHESALGLRNGPP